MCFNGFNTRLKLHIYWDLNSFFFLFAVEKYAIWYSSFGARVTLDGTF